MSMKRMAAVFVAVCLLCSSAAAQTFAEPSAAKEAAVAAALAGTTAEPAVETAETASAAETAAESAPVQESDWRLLLVNPWNPLPEGYTVNLKRMTNGLYVDERIYDDLSAMLGACWDAGLHPVVCSTYRTQATQKRLHQNKIYRLLAAGYGWNSAVQEAARWVAVPGTSEHQTGMALDIVSYSYQQLTHQQEQTAEQQWFMEHCWEYGFILRYPKDKCDVTGIGYEPWHYRYVGREAAAAIRASGLCLEEYLQALEAGTLPADPAAEAITPVEGAAAQADAVPQTGGQPAPAATTTPGTT